MLSQNLVDKSEVGRQQFQHVAVVANKAIEEQLGFPLHRLRQVGIEIWIKIRIRLGILQILQVQPLGGKIGRQSLRLRICQHAPHLLLQRLPFVKFPLARQSDEFVVGRAAPKKVR